MPGAAVRASFVATADAIVRQAYGKLSQVLEQEQANALQKLAKKEYETIIGMIVESFADRKMGLKELECAATRELAIRVIRQSVERYREGLLSGNIGPTEYFKRFYIRHFLAGGLPANAICVVDPNLHRVAKKLNAYRDLTKSLVEAQKQPKPS